MSEQTNETKRPPYCPDHPSTRLTRSNRWGFMMAFCGRCEPGTNSGHVKGYAAQFDWTVTEPAQEVSK